MRAANQRYTWSGDAPRTPRSAKNRTVTAFLLLGAKCAAPAKLTLCTRARDLGRLPMRPAPLVCCPGACHGRPHALCGERSLPPAAARQRLVAGASRSSGLRRPLALKALPLLELGSTAASAAALGASGLAGGEAVRAVDWLAVAARLNPRQPAALPRLPRLPLQVETGPRRVLQSRPGTLCASSPIRLN